MAARSKPNELMLTRLYDAPVKAVWDAWTDTKAVAQWWGPRGFTLTTHSKELKPGGFWRYTMHGPDGKDWPNKTEYFVVEKYSKLVYDHGATDDTPPMFRVTVTFEEVKGKTKMVMIMAFASEAIAKESAKFIKTAGGDGTWDRLGEFLEKDKSGKDKFFINRTFHGDKATMFKMWADPKHLAKWMGPTGSTMEFIRADIKPGGTSFYKMAFQGATMYGRVHYKEVTPNDRLVYTQEFTDEKENISRHPFAPTWPASMLTTVTFHQEDEDHVRVSLVWEVDGLASSEELKTFIDGRAGMTQGWTGSFDKLEELLEPK